MNPTFLNLAEVIEIHQDQIQRYGGQDGIRDVGLLESAVATPAASFGGAFLHSDLCEMAAAYLFHITRNHPFLDGNKRAGTVAAFVFLEMNGLLLNAPPKSLEMMVLKVAAGEAGKSEVAAFLRKHARLP